MTPAPYTEDTLVQQTTAEYLERQLGWESVYAYNNEDFGPESLLGRTSEREVVLTRALRGKLAELNPGLPDDAYDDAVRQITATVASQTIVAANREKYNLIRDGVLVAFRNNKGESGTGAATSLRLRDTEEQPLPLCPRVMDQRRPLPPPGRHRRLRQRPATALSSNARTSTGT